MFDLENDGFTDSFEMESGFGAYQEGAFENDEQSWEGGDQFGFDGEHENDHFDMEGGSDGFDFEGGEMEGDEFLGKLWKVAKKVGKVVAPLAKKFAPQIGAVIGGALGGPAGAAIGGKLGGFAQQLENDESDSEAELNAAPEVAGVDEALSESMATVATRSSPSIAQSMGSAITITIASRAPMQVKSVLPVLAQASGDVARKLAATGDPRARTLIRVLPTIQKRTIATLAAKAKAGKPVTPQTAIRVMRRQANRVLNNPQTVVKAIAGNAQKKRSLDKAAIARAERFY